MDAVVLSPTDHLSIKPGVRQSVAAEWQVITWAAWPIHMCD